MKSLLRVDHQPTSLAAVATVSLPRDLTPTALAERAPKERYKVVQVTARLGAVKNAKVLDLSLSGFAADTNKYLRIGESYAVQLIGGTSIALTAETVWCRMIGTVRNQRDEIEPVYRAGFKFLDLTKELRWQLRQLIKQSAPRADRGIADRSRSAPE